jgi:hypothetical protein
MALVVFPLAETLRTAREGPGKLFWLAAVEAVFFRRRARIDGMEIGDLEAEVMAAAA